MWSDLKKWQKSVFILVFCFIILSSFGSIVFQPYDTGRIEDSVSKYLSSLVYSIFVVLPLLVIVYSKKKAPKIAAGIILGIFILMFAWGIVDEPKGVEHSIMYLILVAPLWTFWAIYFAVAQLLF